jgi:hypothetical protein
MMARSETYRCDFCNDGFSDHSAAFGKLLGIYWEGCILTLRENISEYGKHICTKCVQQLAAEARRVGLYETGEAT